MHRSIRIASACALTGALYLFAGLSAVLHAGEHGLGHDFNGAGLAGVLHTLFALAYLDRAWLHRTRPDDASRQDLFQLSLVALLWAFWRVGVADHAVVPAIVATSWVLFAATLFSPVPEDDEEHDDEPGEDPLEQTALDEADATID